MNKNLRILEKTFPADTAPCLLITVRHGRDKLLAHIEEKNLQVTYEKNYFCGALVPFFQSDSCRLQYLCAELLGYCKKKRPGTIRLFTTFVKKVAHRAMM